MNYPTNPFGGNVLDTTYTVSVGHAVLATKGIYSNSFVVNDNNTNYVAYVEGFSAGSDIGSGFASGAIIATNAKRPAQIEIDYLDLPDYIVDGDGGQYYVEVQNRMNVDF